MPFVASVALAMSLSILVGGTERFTGRLVKDVQLAPEAFSLPEEANDLVDVREGDLYDPIAVRHSIKQLFALGTFSDIKVDAEPHADGVVLTFHLYPRLMVRRVVLADEERLERTTGLPSGERMLEEADIPVNEPFDASHVDQAARRVKALLESQGFLWANVEPEVRFGNARADVWFHVIPGPRARIADLTISGVSDYVRADIQDRLEAGPGDPYIESDVRQRLEKISTEWKERGYYGATIKLDAVPRPPDEVDVTLRPDLGPRVRVRVEGADLGGKELARLVPILEEKSATEDLIEESRARLESFFRERGARDARVTVQRERVEDRQLTLIFIVDAGRRLEVETISIQGARHTDEDELLDLINTRTSGLFRPAPFDARKWEEDLQEVQRYFLRQGFHRARIDWRMKENERRDGKIQLTVQIDEGPRAYLESFEVVGAQEIPAEKIIAVTGLEPGDVLDASQIVRAREQSINLYRNQGYRQANVELSTELDETGTRGKVRLSIHEGVQTYVDRIIITGLARTRERVVRRRITLEPNSPLSSDALLETRQRLIGTRLFRDVAIEVLPPDPSTHASDVLITLEEGPRTTVGWGFGYSERDLARVEAEITRRNLFGLNRTVSLFGRGSFRTNRLIFTYEQPETFGLRLPSFVSVFREEEDRDNFDFKRIGAGIQILKRVSESQTLFFRYTYEESDVFNLEVRPEEVDPEFRSDIRLSKVSASSIVDTRDDPVTPAKGQFRILDVEWAAKALGTRAPYVKGLAQQFWYVPLPARMVGVIALRAGVAQSLRQDRDALIPITERFFAGGANTLRGFGLDEASPKTPNGVPVGGNILTLLNLELRFPIVGQFGGVVFSDNGNVYRRLRIIRLLNWRYNVGFGLRFETPLGPIRADYGIKIDQRPGEPRGRFHVSLGHAF